VRKIRLGKTGLLVSELGFGGIPIQRLGEEEAVRVVQRCLDLGLTFLDTASSYTTSEERIGKAIAGRRDGLVLATKSGARDAATCREHLELSLQRLGVEHIDLFQFHNVSTEEHYEQVMAPGGLLEVARQAQAAGRVGHIGVTSHNLDMAIKLVASGEFETLMFPFCLVTPEPLEKLIPLCRQRDVAFLGMKPLGGGLLENVTLAIKYLRQFPDLLPVAGVQACWEIEEIVAAMEGPAAFTEAERAEGERLRRELGARFCRGCDYCQPCPQEIHISVVLRLRGFARRSPLEQVFGEWGQSLIARAAECAECGECETRCPYRLPIREMLADHVAWYSEARSRYEAGGR